MITKTASLLASEFSGWIALIVRYWPDTPLGNRLRRSYWRRRLRVGESPDFHRGSICYTGAPLTLGARFALGENSVIDPNDGLGIFIGDDVAIARDVFVRGANHRFDKLDVPIMQQGHRSSKIRHGDRDYSIVIEDGVLISRGVVILSGSHIGRGCVIGAGAVISTAIPRFSVVKASPSQVVRSRLDVRGTPPPAEH